MLSASIKAQIAGARAARHAIATGDRPGPRRVKHLLLSSFFESALYLSVSACHTGAFSLNQISLTGTCSLRPAGTYQNGTAQTACLNCSAGLYGPSLGDTNASVCLACPVGTFSSGGASVCPGCPANTYSPGNLPSCLNCLTNTYSAGCIDVYGCQCLPGLLLRLHRRSRATRAPRGTGATQAVARPAPLGPPAQTPPTRIHPSAPCGRTAESTGVVKVYERWRLLRPPHLNEKNTPCRSREEALRLNPASCSCCTAMHSSLTLLCSALS